jgi:hypothetical protein
MRTKILSFVITALMLLTIPGFASDIEVQPTMLSRSNEQDRVWVGTFQIVWNEFMDKYVRNIVRFREGTPISAQDLNKKTFTAASLSNNCYYKYSGNITPNTAKNIKKAISKKFKETSDILDKLTLLPGPNNYLIYVMLKKDFEFTNEFDKLGVSTFGKSKNAEYLGINGNTDKKTKESVSVLYYNNLNDFAVKLSTTGEDEVFLYKNSANKEFKRLYRDMNYKASKFEGETTFGKEDELKVPNIKFDVIKSFDELCNKRVMGTNITILQALESVKFNMDNKGVQLKSEAAMTFVESAFMPTGETEKPEPRYFYCNDTFVIFLKEKDKNNPYFALRVNDISKFQ